MIRRTLLLPFTSLGLAGALALMLLGSNLYTYHRLTDESPIAELHFRKIATQQMRQLLPMAIFVTRRNIHFTVTSGAWTPGF